MDLGDLIKGDEYETIKVAAKEYDKSKKSVYQDKTDQLEKVE